MKCNICNQELKTCQGLSKHISTRHDMTAKYYYDTYIRPPNVGICTCGKPTPFLNLGKGYQKHCCYRCAQLDPETKNNFRISNPQKNPNIKAKTIKTCKDTYGGRGYGSANIQEKAIQTRNFRYGPSNKLIDNAIKTYARENNLVFIEKAFNLNNDCGWIDNIEIVLYYGQRLIKKSDLDYIKNYKGTQLDPTPIIKAIKEVYNGPIEDLYLPDLNIKINYESNHNIALESGKSKDYILNQSLLYREKGCRLIHIFEFEDLDEQLYLLKELINGNDLYGDNFNKNNLQSYNSKPTMIYADAKLTIYGC